MCRPRRLGFSAADRLVAMENLDVLQRNGFEVAVSEDGRGTTEELVLIAQPVSKSTVFDMMGTSISHSPFLCPGVVPSLKSLLTCYVLYWGLKDLEELVSLLHDAPPGRMVRCSKARAMFASRACRSSVMVGDTLSPVQLMSVRLFHSALTYNCPANGSGKAEASWIGRSAHGHYGSTVELSARSAHYAALSQYAYYWPCEGRRWAEGRRMGEICCVNEGRGEDYFQCAFDLDWIGVWIRLFSVDLHLES